MCPLRTRIIPGACLLACVRACVRARARACVRACMRARMHAFVCAYSLLSFLRLASLRTRLHAPPSERESAINAWHCHRSSWQRSAPRTTSERSASIVRKCVLWARARARERSRARAPSRSRTHARIDSHAHAHTHAGRPPATTCRDESRERPRAEDDRWSRELRRVLRARGARTTDGRGGECF